MERRRINATLRATDNDDGGGAEEDAAVVTDDAAMSLSLSLSTFLLLSLWNRRSVVMVLLSTITNKSTK